jgi:hypothetical protein
MSTINIAPAGLELTTGESYGLDPSREIVLSVLDGWDGGGTFRRASTARLNRAGEYSERGHKGAKVLKVQGDAAFDTRREAAEFVLQLEANMADGTAGRLTVVEEDLGLTRWQDVYLTQGVEIERDGADVQFIMNLMAPDPFKRGTGVDTTAGPDGVAQTADAGGTADPELEYLVTGYFPYGFMIRETTQDRAIAYPFEVYANGEPLRIEAATGKVTLGDQDLSNKLTTRNWPAFKKGDTLTLQITGDGSTNPVLTVRTIPTWH